MNRRILAALVLLVAGALVIGMAIGAAKTYQFTGVVKSVDGSTFAVEKNAKETWTFSIDRDTKGTPKVGDKVTVYYKMIATEIEAKPATATPAKKK